MPRAREQQIAISASKRANLEGSLVIPSSPRGIVLFAHGSGSGRFSPRNRYVANVLNQSDIATVLMDLLTKEEERIDAVTGEFRFNIELLAERLTAATEWIKKNDSTSTLIRGYFGASTGAAAALIAAATFPEDTRALVSRGGRPDLAMTYLSRVRTPCLFIVGGEDEVVLDLNRKAMEHVTAEKRLEIVAGATHLFEEPGKLEQVAKLATEWFVRHF